MFIVFNLIYPILIYLGGIAILSDIGEHSTSIELTPMVNFSIIGFFTGLGFMVLAGVMKEAASIYQEQSLTI